MKTPVEKWIESRTKEIYPHGGDNAEAFEIGLRAALIVIGPDESICGKRQRLTYFLCHGKTRIPIAIVDANDEKQASEP